MYQNRLLISISLLWLVLVGCSQPSLESIANESLVYCSENPPDTFNPQLNTDSTTADVSSHQLYNRLIDFDPVTRKIEPALASSWLVSKDGLTYTFQLRRGVKFHSTAYFTPTRNFNADDVIFSINRWRLVDHPYHLVSGGKYPYFQSLELGKYIDSVTRINGYRIEITLKQRDSSFLANLATDFAVILSAEYGAALLETNQTEQLDTHPIGTGPFKFSTYVKGQTIYFEKHSKYWKNPVKISNLIYDITPRSTLRLAKLTTGECDVIALPSQLELDIIREKSSLVLDQTPALNIGFWAFNTQKPPFDNPKIRRALALAIDKSTLLETIYLGNASRAKTLLPPASWAYDKAANDTTYNPVLARNILDEEGLEPGFSMTIWAHPLAREYNPNAYKMAELIKQYLADIDIQVHIVSFDWNMFRNQLLAGMHDSVLIGWSADNGDPDNFFRPLLSCNAIASGTNRAMWCNKEYDRLIYDALQTDDIENRKHIYQQVDQLLFEQLPLIPIAHSLSYQAYDKNVQGMVINPFGAIRFANVSKTQ